MKNTQETPTLEIHTIDGVYYLYCQKMQKYFRYRYTDRAFAEHAIKNILEKWPEDYERDSATNFLKYSYNTLICKRIM